MVWEPTMCLIRPDRESRPNGDTDGDKEYWTAGDVLAAFLGRILTTC